MKEYQASITVDYRGKGHVDVKVWQAHDKRVLLKPWQAYVNYLITGGEEIIWFDRQKNFRISRITQVPASPDGLLKDIPDQFRAELQDIKGKRNRIHLSEKRTLQLELLDTAPCPTLRVRG